MKRHGMRRTAALMLALLMGLALAAPAAAADRQAAEDAAWQLYDLGLFRGTGTDDQGFPIFALDQAPTRAQSVTMLVRLLGQEDAATAGSWTMPFTDVPEWAAPYVGYAYEKGLTLGRSATSFDPDSPVRATEYLTFVLRALGYASGTDFAWDSAWTLTDRLGLCKGQYGAETTNFTRGDVAVLSAAALAVCPKDSEKTLRETIGAVSATGRVQWADECVACREGMMAFSFTAQGKESYTRFTVASATVNGVACTVRQYETPQDVKTLCRTLSGSDLPTDAFALARLSYDEKAALAAADETVTAGGQTYPVLTFHLVCTGTLANKEQVQELVVLKYYVDDYGGIF